MNYDSANRWNAFYLIAALLVVAFVAWSATFHQASLKFPSGDYWEHAAALNSWMADLGEPMSPHVATHEGSARYMPFYFMVAVLGKILSLDAVEALGTASIISVLLMVIGIRKFSYAYFDDYRSPLVLLIVLLSGWGVAWTWSNVYQLRDLLYVSAYPSFFVFSLSFFVYANLLQGMRVYELRNAMLLSFLCALCFVCHPLTGIFTLFFAGTLALFHGRTDWGVRVKLITAILVGALLVEIWPYFSTWSVVLGRAATTSSSWLSSMQVPEVDRARMLYWTHPFYSPVQLLVSLGPALLAAWFFIKSLRIRQDWPLLIAISLMFAVYAANFLVKIPLGHRALLLGMFPVHLLITAWVLRIFSKSNENTEYSGSYLQKYFVGSTWAAACILNIAITVMELRGYTLMPSLDVRYAPYTEEALVPNVYAPVVERLDEGSVVMAPRRAGWPLPAFKGKIVGEFHVNPLISDFRQRKEDTRIFFTASTDLRVRMGILTKYNATHILLDKTELGEVVVDEIVGQFGSGETFGRLVLIQVQGQSM